MLVVKQAIQVAPAAVASIFRPRHHLHRLQSRLPREQHWSINKPPRWPSQMTSLLRLCSAAIGPRIMPSIAIAVGKSRRHKTPYRADVGYEEQVERALARANDADSGEDQDAGLESRPRRGWWPDSYVQQRYKWHQQHSFANVHRGD